MSVKLLVLNLPPNLNHEMFISAFAEFRGFLNGSLHLNPQNELYFSVFPSILHSSSRYGIVEFSSFEFADIARKIRSNFKFMNSRQPISSFLPSFAPSLNIFLDIEFFKSHDSYDYRPNQAGNYGNPNMSYNQMPGPGPGPGPQNFPNQNPASEYNYNQPSISKDIDGKYFLLFRMIFVNKNCSFCECVFFVLEFLKFRNLGRIIIKHHFGYTSQKNVRQPSKFNNNRP